MVLIFVETWGGSSSKSNKLSEAGLGASGFFSTTGSGFFFSGEGFSSTGFSSFFF